MKFTHFLLTGVFLLAAATPAAAGKVYKFRDGQGRVLFTNIVSRAAIPQGNEFKKFHILEKVSYYKDSNVHSYRNWGSNENAVLPSYSKNKNTYDNLIKTAAENYGVDRALVKAIIHTESGFNPQALSKPGAQGLMQLMPATADRYQVRNAFDPTENINAGAKHLQYLLKRFKDNTELALAAYNAGEANVDKYNGIPPFSETQDYVKRVLSRYNNLYKNNI